MANELTIGTKSTGKLTTDATSYVRGRVNSHGDKLLAGATLLVTYTKGDETSVTIAQGGIFPGISTSTVYKMPSSLSGTLSQASWVLSGAGSWQLPIATQPYGIINLAVTYTGSTSATTDLTFDIIYDTPNGLY
jgi:hypothetical protein